MGRHHHFPFHLDRLADLAHDQCFDFGPFAPQHRHKCAIHPQHQLGWAFWHVGPVLLDVFDLGQLHRFVGQADRFGMTLGGRLTHPHVSEAFQHATGLGKRHPGAKMGEVVLQQRGELPWQ